ncbi:MAG: endopeptidase La [Chloroflexi bacterium]|uniref:Lon protease n=1 Tax=Candidatus Chlorohelix allophototropha TaxID=3003348 RepID=A0A8T7M8S6_9CHLR|nr:endopeptidase La [Chloroflexota bacterium]WJW68498.1 endopeptidase La [Chloroflexota bacterium L227-S17]
MSDIEQGEPPLTEEEPQKEPKKENEFPFIPLKNVVVFPGVPVKLVIGSRSMVALEEAQQHYGGRIVVAAQREKPPTNDLEPPTPADYRNELYRVGTLVTITSVQRPTEPSGTTEIGVEGINRVKITRFLPLSAHPNRVQLVESVNLPEINVPYSPQIEGMMRHAKELFNQLAGLNSRISPESLEYASGIRSSGYLADYIAAHLPKASSERIVPEKQPILEEVNVEERLNQICVILATEIELLELDGRIRNKVRQQIDKNQREFYLREQLKAIHDELSGESGNEILEIRKKIEEKNLPFDITDKMLKELNRLERMSSVSPESNVVRTYLDWVLALPWNESTDDNLDVVHAASVLDADHYGLEKVKDRILEFLAVRQLTSKAEKRMKGPILCLAGPPGVGKTSLGQSIARAMGRKFVRISLGGVRDEAEVRGHRRTYVGALPGRLIAALKQAGTRNPVMLLDEVDKMSSDFRGDPTAALLEVLDPEQNGTFVDHYIDLPFDLSEVLFITTANYVPNIPRPLLDRMELIEIGGYTEEEKLQIGRRFLLTKQLEAHALESSALQISEKMMRTIIRNYTREAGVRNLERRLATVCRKTARLMVEGKVKRLALSQHYLEQFLGIPYFAMTPEVGHNQIGIALGLGVTGHGGEILPVEVVTMPGRGNLIVTGRLGEVMQESAKAALSYAKSRSKELGIDVAALEKLDLHIHLPEGATPKDGPSAGITIAVALISALSHRRVRTDTAMTGEITLRGRVLPIGGLKDKSLAAHRAGIKRIITSADNRRDVPELPKIVLKDLEWIWVDSMDEVMREVFVVEDIPPALIEKVEESLPMAAAEPTAIHQNSKDSKVPINSELSEQILPTQEPPIANSEGN